MPDEHHRRLARDMAAALALASCSLAWFAAVTRAAPLRVVLAGDSIVEGCEQRLPGHTGGLAAAVRRALRAHGLRADGRGYIPAHDARSSTAEFPRSYWPLEYAGTWSFEGTFGAAPSSFAPDGFSSSATGGDGVLSATLSADRVGLLYGIAPDAGRFTIALDDRRERVNARGSSPATGVKWLPAPDALDRLRISEIAGGVARVAGVIARREHDDVEVNQVGRSGAQAADALSAPNRQALAALAPGLTVLMFGTNEEGMALGGDVAEAEQRLTRGIVRRARLARRSGSCVVVPHAPNNRPGALQARLSRAAARAARAGGCDFRPVLRGVWRVGDDSIRRGLTADGVHPTAAGYELVGKQIAGLIRRQLATTCRASNRSPASGSCVGR
jgi:lysophospholipase L1-like esterase